MEVTQIILIIAAIIISFMVIRLATKMLFRLIILLIVIVGCYLGYNALTEQYIVERVYSLYCDETNIDQVKCECFVQPIIKDLEARHGGPDFLEELSKTIGKPDIEFFKSLTNQETEIQACFEKNGASGLLDEIKTDLKDELKKMFTQE